MALPGRPTSESQRTSRPAPGADIDDRSRPPNHVLASSSVSFHARPRWSCSGKIDRVREGLSRGPQKFAVVEVQRSRSQAPAIADGERAGRNGRAAGIGVGGVDRSDACPDLLQAAGAGNGVGELKALLRSMKSVPLSLIRRRSNPSPAVPSWRLPPDPIVVVPV